MANGDDQDQVTFQSPSTGTVQPVPQEHWDEALQKGYKPVSHKIMYSPEGKRGMVPNAELQNYMKQGYQTTPETQFEKQRNPVNQPGFWSSSASATKNLLGGLANIPLSPNEIASRVPAEAASMGVDAAARRQEGRSGTYQVAAPAAQLLTGANPRAMEEASNVGNARAILGQAAVPALAAASAPLLGRAGNARQAIGASKAFENIPTRTLGDVIESPSKGPAYAFRKLFPEPPEAANARGPLQSSLEQRMTDVQTARQKELADIEKLKEQDARSRMVRGAQQNRIDTANAKRLQSAEEGRQQQLSDMAKLESQHGQEQADVIERQQRQPDAVTSAVRQGIASRVPTRMPPTVPPPKPLVSLGGERASEPTFSGSEGRAATWTNEDVMRLARQGNREAISQAIRRGMELPAGARYVMGDADPGRAVYNPREVTRFSPEGTPIRNMENPTVPKSSRSRIATSETLEAKPLPFTGPPQAPAAPRPFTIVKAMDIRWAKTPGLPDISIPNNMAEEDIPAYVAEKQALQSKGLHSILGKSGTK